MGRIDFHNESNETLYADVFKNDDDIKSLGLNVSIHGGGGDGGMAPGERIYFDNVPGDYVQVLINTRDGDGEFVPSRGYLVTDMVTSGDRAWVYIGGSKGNWIFRAGAGHKYRVKMQPVAFLTPQWIQDSDGKQLKGIGPGVGDSLGGPVPGQPPVMSNHVIAGRNGTIYLVRKDRLYRYRHLDFANGSSSWDNPVELGSSGWGESYTRAVVASNNGVVYRISLDGKLFWFQDQGQAGTSAAFATNGLEIGSGWDAFVRVMAADDGVLYAVTSAGDLLWFRHDPHDKVAATGKPNWRAGGGGLKVGGGWEGFRWSGVSSGGTIYGVWPDGNMVQYNHLGYLDGSNSWTGPVSVGEGWHMFKAITASNNGVLYAVHTSGVLSWFRHDGLSDASKRWHSVTETAVGWEP